MCFAPQRVHFFNTDTEVVCAFWLRKCASRHNSVHFFNSSTSKSATTLKCFSILTWKCASRHNGVHFVRHLNFQRCSHAGVFFCILTWNCASHYNGVHFFNSSTSKSAPTLRWRFDLKMCFAPQRLAIFYLASPQMASHPALASLLFDPPGPQNIGKKNAGFRDFSTFSRTCIFFLLTLSLLWSSFLSSSESSHLCFFICPYCRKFDF